MSDLNIQLLGGVSHGRFITVPDTTKKISVPVMRVKCEHSPDGAGVETVNVTYRQGENTRPGAWVADQDFHHLGWWCQVCSMNAELAMRENQVKELRAQIDETDENIRTIIAQMKSNQDSHKNYILQLEQALDGER
jgi:hypothetical protein